MARARVAVLVVLTGGLALVSLAGSRPLHAAAQVAPAALKIVVLEGEDGVNVVRQRTAVAPVVEVRDRNDQPVAGAIVRFAIRSGRASFSSGRTLVVTTDAAGRATAAGLTPTGTGALEISATASFQGQTATAVIAQVNVATAAQAGAAAGAGSAAGTSGGAAGAAGGAAGGAGGAAVAGGAAAGAGAGTGISATTIAIVGAAAAGGTIVGVKAIKGNDSGGTAYSGPFSLQVAMLITSPSGANPCTNTDVYEGTLTVTFPQTSGAVSGTAVIDLSREGVLATTCFNGFSGSVGSGRLDGIGLTGTTDSLSFTKSFSGTGTSIDGSGTVVSSTTTWSFNGVLKADGVSGALTVTEQSTAGSGGAARIGNGTAGVNVLLR